LAARSDRKERSWNRTRTEASVVAFAGTYPTRDWHVAGFLAVHAKRAAEVSGRKRKETERRRKRELILMVRFSMEREREQWESVSQGYGYLGFWESKYWVLWDSFKWGLDRWRDLEFGRFFVCFGVFLGWSY
jgi:hypothetical protein